MALLPCLLSNLKELPPAQLKQISELADQDIATSLAESLELAEIASEGDLSLPDGKVNARGILAALEGLAGKLKGGDVTAVKYLADHARNTFAKLKINC